MNNSGKQRIVDGTFADLADYLQERGFIQGASLPDTPIKGYSGLATFLDVSLNTARKYCQDGLFDAAMSRVGNNVRFDRKCVIEIMRQKKSGVR